MKRELYERLRAGVLDGPGELDPAVRRGIHDGTNVPEPLRPYVDKVVRHAYKVTDGDVDRLRETYTEHQIFEATIAAALGAADVRLRAGLEALR
jgi:alkylhydroperoxidase family enzyme